MGIITNPRNSFSLCGAGDWFVQQMNGLMRGPDRGSAAEALLA
jgi:hypothetical protein